jgi:hypothetical protein
MSSTRATASRIAHLRLVAQSLVHSTLSHPCDAARNMLAMQAQDFAAVQMAVGARLPESTAHDVRAAFEAGEIVRSWPLRGTLHLTTAEDLPWLLALTRHRLVASAATRHAGLGLDDSTFEHAREVVHGKLTGGHTATRKALLDAFEEAGIDTSGQRGYHILWYLGVAGTLCLGPLEKSGQAFALLDEWIREPRCLERDEALGELARRYFVGHGPATERDLAWWAKLPLKDVRTGVAVARSDLTTLESEDTTFYLAPDLEDHLGALGRSAPSGALLLPAFDEYLLGYTNRDAVLAAEHSSRVAPGGNGVFQPLFVINGRVEGTWRRTNPGTVTVFPFGLVSASTATKARRSGGRLGHFLGSNLKVELADPTAAT